MAFSCSYRTFILVRDAVCVMEYGGWFVFHHIDAVRF